MSQDHWSVTVRRNGEEIVTIESNMLSGRELSSEDEAVIRQAAEHLMAFVGDGKPTPCFVCGGVEACRDDCELRS